MDGCLRVLSTLARIDNECAHMIEGSLEVQLPTIWTDEAAEMGRGREEKESEENKSEEKESIERRSRCAEREKSVFFRGSGGSKSELTKAAGEEPSGRRDQKSHGSVAGSRFGSQNAKSSSFSEHLWKLKSEKAHATVAQRRC